MTDTLMPPPNKGLGRIKLILLIAIAVLPMILATAMYYGGWGLAANKANRGNLLWPPLSVKLLNATDDSKRNLTSYFSSTERRSDASELKWMLMVTGKGDCTQACQTMLYNTRQVNRALGKDADRVHRFLVMDQPDVSSRKNLAKSYPLLKFAVSPAASLAHLPVSTAASESNKAAIWNIWVADPHGNIMLHYSEQHTGKDILTDMKRLLKLSNIG